MRVFVVALLAAAAGCGGDAPPTGPTSAVARDYDYAFDLETRTAAVVATLEITAPGNCVDLPMRAEALEDVRIDGEPISDGGLSAEVLTACGEGWDAGDEIALSAGMTVPLATWGTSQVGYSVSPDAEDAPFSYLVSWVGGCDRFGPCDPAPDRFATYRFTVAHPAGTRVLCPGVIEASDRETSCRLEQLAPTYSAFGFAASPSWVEIPLGTWAGTRATLFDMPSVGVAEELDAEAHAGFLAWMIDHFGPYPYGDELRIFAGPTYWAGFEHPGNISIDDSLHQGIGSLYYDRLTHTVNHEIAHQWAGDRTTLAAERDFVWKEAMAEYLTFVYEEEELGAEVGTRTASAWKTYSQGALFHPVPETAAPLLDWYGDVYGPGPMILFRQLEAMFGREAVLDAIAALLAPGGVLSIDDVARALEDSTGAELDGYVDAWLTGDGPPSWPRFAVATSQEGAGTVTYTLTQTSPATPMGCAFTVELTGDGGASHEIPIDLGPDGMLELAGDTEPGFPVTGVVLDPHSTCLAYPAAAAAPAVRINPWLAD